MKDHDSFDSYRRTFMVCIKQHECEGVLDGTEPMPDPQVDPLAARLWVKKDLFIQGALLNGADKKDRSLFNDKATSKDMWEALLAAKIRKEHSSHIFTLREMHLYELKPEMEFEDWLKGLEEK
jgi:hypothetical protein